MTPNHSLFGYMIDKRNKINRSNEIKYNNEYSHVALFSSEKIKKEKISNNVNGKFTIGINSTRIRYNNEDIRTHAEIDAMAKLKSKMIRHHIKKQIIVDLYVIRHTKTGLLTESAPCLHCTIELSKNKWLKINKLFYSRNNGTIDCIKFTEWVKKKDHHISKGWKNI
jgi:hypothetical protein